MDALWDKMYDPIAKFLNNGYQVKDLGGGHAFGSSDDDDHEDYDSFDEDGNRQEPNMAPTDSGPVFKSNTTASQGKRSLLAIQPFTGVDFKMGTHDQIYELLGGVYNIFTDHLSEIM